MAWLFGSTDKVKVKSSIVTRNVNGGTVGVISGELLSIERGGHQDHRQVLACTAQQIPQQGDQEVG